MFKQFTDAAISGITLLVNQFFPEAAWNESQAGGIICSSQISHAAQNCYNEEAIILTHAQTFFVKSAISGK